MTPEEELQQRKEREKMQAEIDKLRKECAKLAAETGKITKETFWYPVTIAAGMYAAVGSIMAIVSKLLH